MFARCRWWTGSQFESLLSSTFFHAVLLCCPSCISLWVELWVEGSHLLNLSYVHSLTRDRGMPGHRQHRSGRGVLFHIYGLAPFLWGGDVVSARRLRMNSFSCQTLTQTLLACVLSYLTVFQRIQSKYAFRLNQLFSQFHFRATKYAALVLEHAVLR